jgi:hypothetical protein
MTPDLHRYIEAGVELARTIELVAAEGDLMIAPLAQVRDAVSRAEASLRALSWSDRDETETVIACYRRIDCLRKLASAWLADGGDLKSEDLHDLAGTCRIVKRAARAAGVVEAKQAAALSADHAPEARDQTSAAKDPALSAVHVSPQADTGAKQTSIGAGDPARPHADRAGVAAPAGEGSEGPAEVLPARAGERHMTAKPGKVRVSGLIPADAMDRAQGCASNSGNGPPALSAPHVRPQADTGADKEPTTHHHPRGEACHGADRE